MFPGNTEKCLALIFGGRLKDQKVLFAVNFKCKSTLKEQIEAILDNKIRFARIRVYTAPA